MKSKKADNRSHRDQVHRTLAWQWIRHHRPDVEKIIREEAQKKYPIPETKIDIPSALRNAK